ncbi:hypothetical protein GCM10029976_073180 [Kribbella albertanoniae]|uniref:Uncharacterized protein n=1 Tax=Kribbella albertanoniae TaxID=1266829 RepID=A0A4R4QE73_9ACTN|nr:hypothetical protein [Kribbella albertanoniae]TDC33807.1 hypothetical protein E1261_05010 [Kribbella albertanoniae]
MTREMAARWAGSVVPSWLYRWLLPVGWAVAIVVSMVAGDEVRCSVEDPAYCGPDRTFSLVMIVCLASVALLWWQPMVAVAAGVLFVAFELRFDDLAEAKLAWTIYGALCAALLCWMLTASQKQRSLVRRAQRRQVQVPAAAPVGVTARLLVAGALVLVGVAALLLMRWQDGQEAEHLQRAVEQTAVVKAYGEEDDVILELPDGRTHTVTMYDDYEIGAQIPVLVDPADGDWVRPVAEPADYTHWITVAGGAWVLAGLFALRDARLRRSRPRRAWLAQGLPVRIEPDASSGFAVYSADGAVLLGFVQLEADDDDTDLELLEAFDALDEENEAIPPKYRRELLARLQQYRGEALLVGDLAERAWPTVLLGEHVFRATRPFRTPRQLPWWRESTDGVDGPPNAQDLPPEPEIEPAADLPVLPWEAPLEPRYWWARPALAALLVGLPVAAAVFATWDDWIVAIGIVAFGTELVHLASVQVFFRVTATATQLQVRNGWFEQLLPWTSVTAVEVDENWLNVDTDDELHVLRGVATDQVERVASVFEALRLRAAATGEKKVRRRPAPALWLEIGFLVVGALILAVVRFA